MGVSISSHAHKPILAGRRVEGPASARLVIDGSAYTNFCGCGYLALSAVPEVRAAVRDALDRGVPLAQQLPAAKGAKDPIFDDLERTIARICKTEASVYFASGYLIGMVGLAGIEEHYDAIFIDEHAHYNLKDAVRLLGMPSFTYAHCNVEALRMSLREHVSARQRPLVVTDGVFPVSGRVPPLADYARELAPYSGRMYIDEAHSFGVIGAEGRGAAEYCGVESIATIGGTLSKAYGAQGAFVACSATSSGRLREIPPIRGACAGSPLSAVASRASLEYVATRPELRDELRDRSEYLRSRVRGLGVSVIDTPAPIVSFQMGTRHEMESLQHRAFDLGLLINYSNYIGAGNEGTLVCAVFRDHSHEDIDRLVDVLRKG